MRIRPYDDGDREAVVRLHEELQSFERAFRPTRAAGRAVSERQVDEYLTMLADEEATLLIAEREGQAVGYVFFLFEGEMLETQARQVYVQDITVTASARRQGVGGALMAAVRYAAHDGGAGVIDLQVLVGNDTAAAFYERQGFKPAYVGLKAELDRPDE